MSDRRGDQLLCVLVVVVLSVIVTSNQGEAGPVDPLAYLWVGALGLLMLIRRSHPLLVLALTTVIFFGYHAAGYPALGVAIPVAAALFSAAQTGHTRAALATGAVTLAGATAYRLADRQSVAYVLGWELATHVALIAAVVALGHSARTTRELRERTEQVTRLLDRQRSMDAEARMRDDRLSLARDLHDSIGHSLTLAAMHAGLAQDPRAGAAQREQSLGLVRTAVSDALSHLRRTVRVLRGGAGPRTTPGLDDLDRLARAADSAGYDVRVAVDRLDLSPEVETAAFRLVQESVTNVLRHSSGRRIDVRVSEPTPGTLEVRVADDGRNAEVPELVPGHGLSGMRERVATLGGTMHVDADARGWVVRALLPREGSR